MCDCTDGYRLKHIIYICVYVCMYICTSVYLHVCKCIAFIGVQMTTTTEIYILYRFYMISPQGSAQYVYIYNNVCVCVIK